MESGICSPDGPLHMYLYLGRPSHLFLLEFDVVLKLCPQLLCLLENPFRTRFKKTQTSPKRLEPNILVKMGIMIK